MKDLLTTVTKKAWETPIIVEISKNEILGAISPAPDGSNAS